MLDNLASRRKVLASAVVGVAVLAPMAFFGTRFSPAGSSAGEDGVAVVPGVATRTATLPGAADAAAPASAEMLSWQGAVGQSFRIASRIGSIGATLTSVADLPAGGARPANLRQQPFALTFKLDSGVGAAADEIYFVESGVLAPMDLFLQEPGNGVLTAILN